MKRSLLSLGMAIAACSLGAQVQSQSFSFVPSGLETLTFNKFDSLGGVRVLTAVHVQWSLATVGGSIQADNEGRAGGAVTANLQIFGSLGIGTVGGLGAMPAINYNITAGPFGIGPHDGDVVTNPIGTFDSAPGEIDYGSAIFANQGPTTKWVDVNSAFFPDYIAVPGNTTFDLTPTALTTFSSKGVSGLVTIFTNPEVEGIVEVRYEYVVVPEPSTMAIIAGLGLLVIMTVRRRR